MPLGLYNILGSLLIMGYTMLLCVDSKGIQMWLGTEGQGPGVRTADSY